MTNRIELVHRAEMVERQVEFGAVGRGHVPDLDYAGAAVPVQDDDFVDVADLLRKRCGETQKEDQQGGYQFLHRQINLGL